MVFKEAPTAGRELYPLDVCLQTLQENPQGWNNNEFSSGDSRHIMVSKIASNFDIPEVIFDHLKSNKSILSYIPSLPDFSINSALNQSFSSQNYGFLHRPKRLRGSYILLSGVSSGVTNGLPQFDQFQNNICGKLNQHYGLSFPCDLDPDVKNPSVFRMTNGSHALLNGNFSASKPILGSLKLELPSLQYQETDLGCWGSSSPQPPSLDSVGAFIRSPSPTRLGQSDCVSPPNSVLLDALLYEPQTLSCAKNQSLEKSSSSWVVTPGDMVHSSTFNLCEREWEYGDPNSPLGCSAACIFNDHTPLSGSSSGEHPAPRASHGCEIKQEPFEHASTPDEGPPLSA